MEAYSLTLDEACAFIGISRPTASNWIRSGRLIATRKDPSKKINRHTWSRGRRVLPR